MKVGGTKGPNSASGTKKGAAQKGSSDVDFSQYVKSGNSSAAGVSATQNIAQLDALLAAQEVEDPTQREAKKQAKMRAGAILEKLDQIRLRMLSDDLTVGHMVDVADVVASHRDKIDDPRLSAIMDEIDLRAQVEIAKMRVSLDTVKSS